MVVDEPNQSWIFDQQGEKHRDRYEDGVLHTVDGPLKFSFEHGAPHPVLMIMPELMLQWGPPASYLPILVQRIRDHWLLFTFEHEHDPAQRNTLVIDERTGIARRSYGSRESTIITEVRPMKADEPIPPRPRFTKLTERPPLEYLEE
jgi:hypothetical protein